MLFEYNEKLESRNFVDGIDFSKNDPCIWNVYPPGAAGDLLASIVNMHYGRTGSNYFGINKNGQVIFRPSDYKITNTRHRNNLPLFDNQHFFDIAESLSEKNLNYSILDQVLFSCHLYRNDDIKNILDTFPKAKVIRTYLPSSYSASVVNFLKELKNNNKLTEINFEPTCNYDKTLLIHESVLNIPFGALFSSETYYRYYDRIINFLGLPGRLICFDYIEYYISKQHTSVRPFLVECSKNL